MKMTKLFIAAAMLAVSATASAQFTNTAKTGSSSAVNTDGWGTFYLQWNPSSISVDVSGADDQSFTGFSVGYSQAFSIVKNTPLFLEAGAALQYSFYKEDGDVMVNYTDEYGDYVGSDVVEGEEKFNMFSVKVPVNLLYKFDIPNSSVALTPFAGVTMRYNMSGKKKVSATERGYDDVDDAEYDLFDKKDMGGKDYTWKRFQVGWQVGVNAHFGESFLVGVSYGSDFSEICKKTKIKTTSVTLGYRF